MRVAILVLSLWILTSSVSAQEAIADFGPAGAAQRMLIRSTTDIEVFGPVLETFLDDRPGLAIHYEQWGSNDLSALTATQCEQGGEVADLVISSAVDLQVELVNRGCARAHLSPLVAALNPSRNWRNEVIGITEEPAVLIYNKDLVSDREAPASRFDLIDLLRPEESRFAGRVATYDIEASGLGYLFAFSDSLQANTFGRLLEAFGRSRAVATCCSAEIIDAVAEGKYLVAYNVLGSYALARAARDPRIGVRAPTDYTLMLSRAALIPKDASAALLAGSLIDFLLSTAGRRALTAAHLIVEVGGPDDIEGDLFGGGASSLRPIPLGPVLLASMDRQKRKLFLDQWNDNLAAP